MYPVAEKAIRAGCYSAFPLPYFIFNRGFAIEPARKLCPLEFARQTRKLEARVTVLISCLCPPTSDCLLSIRGIRVIRG